MIFYLHCELSHIRQCDADVRDETVRLLLRAHRNGDHVVIISREICRFLIENADLSRAEKAMLERILFEHPQRASLPRVAKRYILVSPSGAVAADDRAIQVSFRKLVEAKITDRSILLVENIARDGVLYGELLRNHHDLHACPPPAYVPMHGGGSDLPTVFIEQINQRRVVCAIVDTDRLAPSSEPVAKLEKLGRIATEMNWPCAFSSAPPCREAENCLPMDVVFQLESGISNPSKDHYLSLAEEEGKLGHDVRQSFWLYADLKEGICPANAAKIGNDADRAWLRAKLAVINIDIEVHSLSGFGNRVFDQMAAHGQSWSILRQATRTNSWREIFDEFVAFLVWVFAGGRKVVT
ncbi:hypothetical protein JIR23_02745 [Bradyrhizobium diazoefficiens]|nr:hypothetical protein [Bradyrhizobium diazoefficiens]QQN64759.1 hypothetical protein JIR23_02745 [Bradyrhizobium diazoefficiens]